MKCKNVEELTLYFKCKKVILKKTKDKYLPTPTFPLLKIVFYSDYNGGLK